MSYSIKQISDQSYILSELGTRIAILTKTEEGITAIGKLSVKQFKNWDVFEKYLGKPLEFETDNDNDDNSTKETVQLSGLPVKHSPIFDTQENPVSYTKIAGSKVRYAAGYWGISFREGWVPSFCPKLSTLDNIETIGPFTSKLELNTFLSSVKNKTNI
jgi:hypothetical protein